MKHSYPKLLFGVVLALALSASVPWLQSAMRRLGTSYAPGYSEQAYQAIAKGDSEQKVLEELGPPLWEVGFRFYYYYRGRELVFLVNKEDGTASLADFSKATEEQKAPYSDIETLEHLTEVLGVPVRFSRVDSWQSDDPDVKTLVYSQQNREFNLPWWQYRLIYTHKETGKVTGKNSGLRGD